MSAHLRDSLVTLLGGESVLPPEENGRWAASEKTPAAVICPGSGEEVAAVLERATREGWTVVPAGMGNRLMVGNPVDADVVLSTSRIAGITEYEPADLTLTAGAGVPIPAVDEATQTRGQWLALDPAGSSRGSLGALMAMGWAGPLRQSYGTPRDHVLGLTLVTGDGRVLSLGGRVVKNVAGFDLTRLAVGSWGALGVVVSVSVRLFPLPSEDMTLLYRATSSEELVEAARTLAVSPLPLGALELVEGAWTGDGDDARLGALAVRLLGSRSEVDEMERRVQEELHALNPQRLEGPGSKGFHERVGREEEGGVVLRLALLPARLPDGLAMIRGFSEGLGVDSRRRKLAAHVGAGIIRVVIDEGATGGGMDAATWGPALAALREQAEEEGGSLTVSSGPPALVRTVGAWGNPGPVGPILSKLKDEFDPGGVLARGRFVV